jgi:hypothetical protein
MTGRWRSLKAFCFDLLTVLLLGTLPSSLSYAQALAPVYGNGPIPDTPFTSWSLFLMCNPEWLLKKQEATLHRVFEAYLAFGRTGVCN